MNGLQIICGICGKKSGYFPKNEEEFKNLVPEGWHTVPFPIELWPSDRDFSEAYPYRLCSIKCLHKMEQLLKKMTDIS